MTTPTDRAYLAGILDGEGSISMTRITGAAKRHGGWWRITITVSSCDRPLIEWLIERWKGSGMFDMDRGPTKRLQHRWTVVGHAARQVLQDTLPYLIIKRQRAIWAIEVLEIQRQERRGHRQYTEVERERLIELRRLFDTDPARSWSVKGRPAYDG